MRIFYVLTFSIMFMICSPGFSWNLFGFGSESAAQNRANDLFRQTTGIMSQVSKEVMEYCNKQSRWDPLPGNPYSSPELDLPMMDLCIKARKQEFVQQNSNNIMQQIGVRNQVEANYVGCLLSQEMRTGLTTLPDYTACQLQ